jgi:hypothetical protein
MVSAGSQLAKSEVAKSETAAATAALAHHVIILDSPTS